MTALFWILMTIALYRGALWLQRKLGSSPIANPVLLSMAGVIAVIEVSDGNYANYLESTEILHGLLGTATVALAIPLHRQLRQFRHSLGPILFSITIGSLCAATSTLAFCLWLDAPQIITLSLAPKTATSPVAMEISRLLGGLPPLTAVVVILTGIIGAMIGPAVIRRAGVRGDQAVAISIGTAASGIGTASVLQRDLTMGAYAGFAMGVTALTTTLFATLLIAVVPWF